jgi:hypothetical protein
VRDTWVRQRRMIDRRLCEGEGEVHDDAAM